MDIIKNQNYIVKITGITSEGNGVAKIDGYAVFIPNTAIDDVCEIKLIKVNKNFGYGKLEKIITPSNARIDVDCEIFHQCGGCTYRHISYEKELEMKADYVKDCFVRLGSINIKHNNIIKSQSEFEYRNKAQYPVGKGVDSKAISGFYAKRSHRIVDSKKCRLQPQIFDEIKSEVLKFINEYDISVYDEKENSGLLRHIYIRQAEATNEIMVCLVTTKKNIPNIDKLINKLTEKFPPIVSIIINVNNQNTNVILGEKCFTVFESDSITDIMCGVKVKISPLSFYQVNKKQAEILYQKAIEYANLQQSDTLLDLYCGIGTIGLSACKKVKQLIGVEIVEQAIENAKENAKINGFENIRFICSDAGKAAQMLAEEGIIPDVIIVDPPRKGIDNEVIDAIVKMSPKRVVMVSCNPSTAARDCHLLEKKGYIVKAITPVDMFPRTTHVETCVLLSHKNPQTSPPSL